MPGAVSAQDGPRERALNWYRWSRASLVLRHPALLPGHHGGTHAQRPSPSMPSSSACPWAAPVSCPGRPGDCHLAPELASREALLFMCIYRLFMCPLGLRQVRGSRKGWLQERLGWGGGGGLRPTAAPTLKDSSPFYRNSWAIRNIFTVLGLVKTPTEKGNCVLMAASTSRPLGAPHPSPLGGKSTPVFLKQLFVFHIESMLFT